MSNSRATRLYSVSLSSVKRYVRIVSRGESLKPRKGGGRPPKTDKTVEKLLEDDVQERSAHHGGEASLPRAFNGQDFERLHRSAAFVAAGLQAKKRTVEAMEQGEFLRVAWRVMVAEKVEEGPKSACAKGLSLPLFTELPRRDVLGNWVSGVWLSRKLRRLYRRKESRGC